MEPTIEELKEHLAVKFTEQELIDMLELTTFDLVEILQEEIEEKYDVLVSELKLIMKVEEIEQD